MKHKLNNFLNYFRLVKMLNKSTMQLAWYKILQSIVDFANEVQKSGKPMLTKIAVIDMSKEKIIGDFDMVSLWAGCGDTNPIERGRQVKDQNIELKRLLTLASKEISVRQNKDLLLNINIVLDTFE